MANQIVEYKKFTFGDLDETMIQTIHETIAKDCTEPQFKLFMTIAKSLGANPLLNEIYPTVYQGKLTPQFGIGFHVKQARKHEDYRGYDAQTVHENDTFSLHYEKADDDERYFAVIDEFKIGFPRGRVIGGFAFAYRDGFQPFSVVMDVAEVEQFLNSQIGMQKTMWTKNLVDMFKKHMAKRVLNAAFGLGFEDEESSDSGNSEPYVRREINPDAEPVVTDEKPNDQPKGKTKAAEASKVIDAETTPVVDEAKQIAAINTATKAGLTALGIVEKEARGAYMKEHMPMAGDAPTLEERKAFLKFVEAEVAKKQDAAADDLPD